MATLQDPRMIQVGQKEMVIIITVCHSASNIQSVDITIGKYIHNIKANS